MSRISNEEALDRLREVVDECIGLQICLDWDELISLVEKQMRDDFRRKFGLAEALNDVYHEMLNFEALGVKLPAGMVRAEELERICDKRGVRNALSSAEDCGRSSPTGSQEK